MPLCKPPFRPGNNFKGRKQHNHSNAKMWFLVLGVGLFTLKCVLRLFSSLKYLTFFIGKRPSARPPGVVCARSSCATMPSHGGPPTASITTYTHPTTTPATTATCTAMTPMRRLATRATPLPRGSPLDHRSVLARPVAKMLASSGTSRLPIPKGLAHFPSGAKTTNPARRASGSPLRRTPPPQTPSPHLGPLKPCPQASRACRRYLLWALQSHQLATHLNLPRALLAHPPAHLTHPHPHQHLGLQLAAVRLLVQHACRLGLAALAVRLRRPQLG